MLTVYYEQFPEKSDVELWQILFAFGPIKNCNLRKGRVSAGFFFLYNAKLHVSLQALKKYFQLSYYACFIYLNLPLEITNNLDPYKTIFIGKNPIPRNPLNLFIAVH